MRSARRGRDSDCAARAARGLPPVGAGASLPSNPVRAGLHPGSQPEGSGTDRSRGCRVSWEGTGRPRSGGRERGLFGRPKGGRLHCSRNGCSARRLPAVGPPSIREASATAIAVHWVRDHCHQPRPHSRRGATLRIPLPSAGAATAWQGQRTGLRRPRDGHQRRIASEGASRCGLRMARGTEIGHLRAQRCDGPRAAPGHGLEDLQSPSELRVAPDPTCDPVV